MRPVYSPSGEAAAALFSQSTLRHARPVRRFAPAGHSTPGDAKGRLGCYADRMKKRLAAILVMFFGSAVAPASQLPQEACSTHSLLFASGFDATPQTGSFDLLVEVPDQGVRSFPLQVPASLMPPRRIALLISLHGAAGAGNAAAAATVMRDSWIATSESGGFITVAPVASGAQGGWLPSMDYPALAAAINELQRRYPIDMDRLYLHGFSAGGHVVHDLGLYNANYFAAYVVNAGVLDAFAGASAPLAAARQIPLQVRMGSSDSLLGFAQTDRGRFLAAGWTEPTDYHLVEFAGGHVFDASHTDPAWNFLCRRALPL